MSFTTGQSALAVNPREALLAPGTARFDNRGQGKLDG